MRFLVYISLVILGYVYSKVCEVVPKTYLESSQKQPVEHKRTISSRHQLPGLHLEFQTVYFQGRELFKISKG